VQLIVLKIEVPFPRRKQVLLLPNRKLADQIMSECLEISGSSREFMTNFHNKRALVTRQATLRISPKRFRSDLLDSLLSLQEIEDIKKEITYYWRSKIAINEIQRFLSLRTKSLPLCL